MTIESLRLPLLVQVRWPADDLVLVGRLHAIEDQTLRIVLQPSLVVPRARREDGPVVIEYETDDGRFTGQARFVGFDPANLALPLHRPGR